jgi:hypothetical protein
MRPKGPMLNTSFCFLYSTPPLLNVLFCIFVSIKDGMKSRDSSVGITLDYGLDNWGSRVRFPAGAGNFSLHRRVQNGSGAHPTSYPMCTRALSLGVKRLEHEADHSPPSSAEVKE